MIVIAGNSIVDIVDRFVSINNNPLVPWVIVSNEIEESTEESILDCIEHSSSVFYYRLSNLQKFLDFPFKTNVLVVGDLNEGLIKDMSEKFDDVYVGIVLDKVIDGTKSRFKSSVFNNTMSLLTGIILCGLFGHKEALLLVFCYVLCMWLFLKFLKNKK